MKTPLYNRSMMPLYGMIAGCGFHCFFPSFIHQIMFVVGWALCHRHLQQSKDHFFIQGYLFGVAYFFSSLYWVGLGVCTWGYHECFAYIISFFLSLFLALFIAIPIWICQKIPDQYRHLSYPILIAAFEMLRGMLFPWNYPTYILWLEVLQIIRFIPVEIVNFFVLIVCFSFFNPYKNRIFQKIGGVCIICNHIYGMFLLNAHSNKENLHLNVRLIQPCIPQNVPVGDENYIDFLLQLTTLKGDKDIDIVIWPECSLNIALNRRQDLLHRIFSAIPSNTSLIMSGVFIDHPKIYNSLYVLQDHEIKSIYHKNRLVPFGEFVPLRHINPFPKITSGTIDYTPGQGPKILPVKGKFFLPSICYEIIFSTKMQTSEKIHPQFIVNVTNDGWFGRSQGPYQHLKIVQVRAIESGMRVIRCCNTGISCIIDSKGRIESQLNLMNVGYIDHGI